MLQYFDKNNYVTLTITVKIVIVKNEYIKKSMVKLWN